MLRNGIDRFIEDLLLLLIKQNLIALCRYKSCNIFRIIALCKVADCFFHRYNDLRIFSQCALNGHQRTVRSTDARSGNYRSVF